MKALEKVLSRKFVATLLAIIAVFETTHLDTTSKIIIAVVASVYVIAETVLDKGALPPPAPLASVRIGSQHDPIPMLTASNIDSKDVARLIEKARRSLVEVDSRPPDTVASPPPASPSE